MPQWLGVQMAMFFVPHVRYAGISPMGVSMALQYRAVCGSFGAPGGHGFKRVRAGQGRRLAEAEARSVLGQR